MGKKAKQDMQKKGSATSLGQAKTGGVACKDSMVECAEFAILCSDDAWVRTECPKTCNICKSKSHRQGNTPSSNGMSLHSEEQRLSKNLEKQGEHIIRKTKRRQVCQ